jgi:hypothetical protein
LDGAGVGPLAQCPAQTDLPRLKKEGSCDRECLLAYSTLSELYGLAAITFHEQIIRGAHFHSEAEK